MSPSPRPVILASVGTDVHPFDRMVDWLDEWARLHPETEVIVQHGTSRAPAAARGVEYFNHEALLEHMNLASVVITHGGPATIMEIRACHGRPIVIPRNPALGEHVDHHQMHFSAAMARRDLVDVADTAAELIGHIERQLADPPTPAAADGVVPEGVRRFAEEVDQLLARTRRSVRAST